MLGARATFQCNGNVMS